MTNPFFKKTDGPERKIEDGIVFENLFVIVVRSVVSQLFSAESNRTGFKEYQVAAFKNCVNSCLIDRA